MPSEDTKILEFSQYQKSDKSHTVQKMSYSELFWCVFSHIRIEYGEIQSISSHSVQMWENTDQNNSKYGHFLRSAIYCLCRS